MSPEPQTSALAASAATGGSTSLAKMSILAGTAGSSLVKSVQAITLGHPILILGALGGALLLVGLGDLVGDYRARRQEAAESEAAEPIAPL